MGYPWWEHIKGKGGGKGSKGGKNGGGDASPKSTAKPKSSGTELQKTLEKMEGRQYPSYKDLMGGGWDMEGCSGAQVFFDRVQGDSYAPPSWIRVRIPARSTKFPSEYVSKSRARNIALCDFLTRVLADRLRGGSGTDWTRTVSGGGWGGSKGGDITLETPGQYVLARTSIVCTAEHTECRLTLSLPARGRSVEGHRAAEIIGGLMDAVKQSLFFDSLDKDALRSHVLSYEDQDDLRQQMRDEGLVAFVANGSVLPRKSGVDDRPMTKKDDPNLVVFESPSTLEVSLTVKNKGTVTGMGIKQGITMIVGGGFHGKSTLLQALQGGIYNKVDGDGREFVVCDPDAVKIRSEDGRCVGCANISPFIKNLPFERDTTAFSTSDASGSTSQAANIVEALELGAKALLIDEDTCATNFMIRDTPMIELVAPEKEPITPFIQRVRPLFDDQGVSTIMVIGGSGDFFPVADTIICMERYAASDVTRRAHEICEQHGRKCPERVPFPPIIISRALLKDGLAADGKVSAKSLRCLSYGSTEVELTFVEQLVEVGQAKAIMDCLQFLASTPRFVTGSRLVAQVVEELEAVLQANGKSVGEQGLDAVSRDVPCPFYAMPRRYELAAALNRLRTAKFVQRVSSERPAKAARKGF